MNQDRIKKPQDATLPATISDPFDKKIEFPKPMPKSKKFSVLIRSHKVSTTVPNTPSKALTPASSV